MILITDPSKRYCQDKAIGLLWGFGDTGRGFGRPQKAQTRGGPVLKMTLYEGFWRPPCRSNLVLTVSIQDRQSFLCICLIILGVEGAKIILIYTPKNKDLVNKFEEDLIRNFGDKVPLKLWKYAVENKEELLLIGQDFAERFFNETLGLRVQERNFEGDLEKNMATLESNLAFTPTGLSSPNINDKRVLAECYVYVKMFKIENFPAVIVDDVLIAEGRIPSIEELSLKLGVSILPQRPQKISEVRLEAESKQEAVKMESEEPLYVHIKHEDSETQPTLAQPHSMPTETLGKKAQPVGLEVLEDETKRRIAEILNRTKFRGPDECTSCLYFIEGESRCALLHMGISDPKRPLCRIVEF